MFRATGQVNGKWRTLAPTESKPLNRLQKNVTDDYVRETNHCANLGANPSTRASGQIGEIKREIIFIYINVKV